MDLVPSIAQKRSITGGESAFWGRMLRLSGARGRKRHYVRRAFTRHTTDLVLVSTLLALTMVWVPSLLSRNTVQPLLFEGHRKLKTYKCSDDPKESAEWCRGLRVQQQQSPVRSCPCLPRFKKFEMQRTCKSHPSHKSRRFVREIIVLASFSTLVCTRSTIETFFSLRA